jgi:short-subunit dehydrogenase
MTHWKRALVTGASSGIGAAFARELAAQGTELILVARRENRLRELADELQRDHGTSTEVLVADLTNGEDRLLIEKRLEDSQAPVDLLVNNAGGHRLLGKFADLPREVIESDVLLNAVAVVRLTHAALRPMIARRDGTVIQVSSATAFGPGPGQAAYVASKAFVNTLSQSVHHELRGTGVRLTVVAPGFTRTETPPKLGFNASNVPRLMWQDSEQVAKYALRASRRGRRVVYTSGRLNKLLGRLSYYGPRPIVVRVVAAMMRPRGSEAT